MDVARSRGTPLPLSFSRVSYTRFSRRPASLSPSPSLAAPPRRSRDLLPPLLRATLPRVAFLSSPRRPPVFAAQRPRQEGRLQRRRARRSSVTRALSWSLVLGFLSLVSRVDRSVTRSAAATRVLFCPSIVSMRHSVASRRECLPSASSVSKHRDECRVIRKPRYYARGRLHRNVCEWP